MDTITTIAASIDNPALKAAGMLLDNSLAYPAIVFALLLLGEGRNDKRIKIALSLALAFVAVTGIKYVMAHERPCVGEEWCPDWYSFPSMHAAIAFTLMTGFLGKKSFPAFFLFALFVSFTRMNLMAHLFLDIAGALPLALICYYLTDIVWQKNGPAQQEAGSGSRGRKAFLDRETGRQLFHMAVGLAALAVVVIFGRGVALAAAFFTLLGGILVINARLQDFSMPIVQWFEERFERKDLRLPGWGSACYAAGVLLLLSFLSDVSQISAGIFVLAVGDSLSTIVGLRGKMKLPYNEKKTLEGLLAMFLSSLPAYAFTGMAALPLAIVASLAESVPRIDDNLSIPIACVVFFLVTGS